MIPTERQAAWLSSRAEQQRTGATIQSFQEEWSVAPLFAQLERELVGLQSPTPEQVLAAARRFFAKTGDIRALVDAMIQRCGADPFFVPAFHPLASDVHSGLLLYNHADLSIALGVTGVDMLAAKKAHRRDSASIGFSGLWTLFRYLTAGDAVVSFWEAPQITEGFTAATAGRCRCVGRRRIRDGEEILIDGSRQSFIVEHAGSDMVYLQAVVRAGAAPLTAEYDSETRRFIGATSTDEASSRVQMMATLLRQMEREDAAPLLRQLLGSPHFYTRWYLMRELLALDAEAAHPDLTRMAAEDPHPEVRAAAAQTLRLFFADSEERVRTGAVACPA